MISRVAAACRAALDPKLDPEEEPGEHLDLTSPFAAEFVSAFSEIFNNIVLHSYGGGSDDEIVIELSRSDDRLVAQITDHGAPFDPSVTPPPDLDNLPEGGMGIFIARAFLDAANYQPGPPNLWTLEKCYRSADTASTT